MEASDLGLCVFRLPSRVNRVFTAAFVSIASGHEIMEASDLGFLYLFSFRLLRWLAVFVSIASGHEIMEVSDLGLFVVRVSFRRMRRSSTFASMASESEVMAVSEADLGFLLGRFSFNLSNRESL